MTNYNSVLIVDDDPLQVALMASYFAGIGVPDIAEISTSKSALEFIRTNLGTIDLIVTDLQMPEMDGIEFMAQLKSVGYRGKLAIVSGVKEDLLGHAARLAKMHDFDLIGQLSKPLNRDALDLLFLHQESGKQQKRDPKKGSVTPEEYARGIENREIKPYYQPKVSVSSGKIIGAESLVRWIMPDGRHVTPDILLGHVEQHNLIEQLTFYLLDRVLEDLPKFLEISPDISIAVNIAPAMIGNRNLPNEIISRVDRCVAAPRNLSFEVTEDRVLQLDVTTLEVLSRLRVNGFDLAIDDFGTGSSNIQTLRDFPYSELKIDRAFISDALQNTFSRETVFAAVALAHDQGMRVVAEGVENMSTFDLIRDMGIEIAQGFLISKALPPEEFERFLIENHNGVAMLAA